MASLNQTKKSTPVFTHEGARGYAGSVLDQLRRTVMCCMLWEDNFYEDGEAIAERIKRLVHEVSLEDASKVAIYARERMKLRHVPLLIVREMARHPKLRTDPSIVSHTLAWVIQRADELTEFLAIYWKDGKCPLSKQIKLGLAKAFAKFNEYELAKYNRNKDIKLRDVLFLCHSKPADVSPEADPFTCYQRAIMREQNTSFTMARPTGFTNGELLYGKLIYDRLETPDTWEVELSASSNKLESWSRLLEQKKLGDLAFLRNLRNMLAAGVDLKKIIINGDERKWGRVLPFRFIAAANIIPQLEPYLEMWMLKCLAEQPRLPGTTGFLNDVSGSMFGHKVSAKSDIDRFDAAAALSILGRELCEHARVFSFSDRLAEVAPRRGFALRDALRDSQMHSCTYLGQALNEMQSTGKYDRIIVLTDEQSSDTIPPNIANKVYVINVASNQNGIASASKVMRINGWSEAVFDFITLNEQEGN